MKIKFPLTPGEYLFFTGLVYVIVGMVNIFWHKFTETEYIQMIWLAIVALPLFIPMRRVVSVGPFWKML